MGLALVAMLAAGTLAAAQDVTYNAMPGTDFAKYKTYEWVSVKDGAHPDPIVDQQIEQALDAQLATKGLTKTDADIADLYVPGVGQPGEAARVAGRRDQDPRRQGEPREAAEEHRQGGGEAAEELPTANQEVAGRQLRGRLRLDEHCRQAPARSTFEDERWQRVACSRPGRSGSICRSR
jgi:hypothetical protein